MYIIRLIVSIILVSISTLLELAFKIVATIPTIIVTVILTVLGQKSILNSETFKQVFEYCTFWNVKHQYKISSFVFGWTDPDID